MEIKVITEENFNKYGQILKGYDFTELLAEALGLKEAQ